jgi:general secretion pathway protein E
MNSGLTFNQVCDMLLKRQVITVEQHRLIHAEKDTQRLKLQKIHEISENSSSKNGFAVLPADIIASLNLTSQSNGITETLTEEKIMREVAADLGIPFKKIDPLELDLEVVTKTLPKTFAIKNLAVPIAVENGELKVAMVDPLNEELLNDIRRVTPHSVAPVVSTKSDIIKLIREFYGFKRSIVLAEQELDTPLVDLGNLEQYARLKSVNEIESTDKHIKNAVEYLFHYALEQRASDIHVEPKRERAMVRLRIDGILHDTYSMPRVVHNAVISRIKTLSRLNIAEKRRPQDGRIKLQHQEQDVEVRVSTVPVAFGEKAVMRILNASILFQDLQELGFSSHDLIQFHTFLEHPHGIILVTGPTGSGKTTTLYSALRFLSSTEKNITTVEDPIEMVCEEFNQIAVQPAIDVTFGTILRNILRQDPDIIMIGEIRDQETAQHAIQAALTGHLVLSTLHTNDAASAITRLIDLGIEPFLLSSTLLGVAAQRLVRTVCPHCAESFSVSNADLWSMGIDVSVKQDFVLQQGNGCKFCRQTGYLGRQGVFEVLPVNDEMRRLIEQKESAEALKKAACLKGMKPLRENAIAKLLKGITTHHEVIRCTANES